jgi:hypothetical protein
VIAQLNLWYFGAGCNGGFEDFMHCSGRRTTPFEPVLGHTYTSSDSRVIQQQIDWAADYGVDAFSLEWTTPRGIGTSGSLEDNIDDAFLKAPNLARIRWCIFYDTILRITQDPAVNANISNGVNFDDPKVYNAFVSDFDHFATKYFAQPQYLKIDGRPVIYIYAAWNFHGNFAGAIKDARAKALAQGYDVFIVGDALRADTFNSKLVSQFDANTTFTFLIPGLPTYSDMGKTAPAIDMFFQTWRKKIQGLTVVGRNEAVNFQPAWAPQFDNRLFGDGNPIYVPALSKDQVTAMAQVARDNAEPVGSLNQMLVWINTWNNWAEATTIEPTANQGAKYPTGNYQFDMLEIVRDIYGQQSFGNGPPFPATEISNAPGVPAPEFTLIPNISQTQQATLSNPAPPSGVNPPAPAQPVSEPYVDRVVSFTPGNPSNPQFSSTDAALGPPDFNASNLSGFVNLGVGGSITLEFVDIVAVDAPGNDISIFGDPQNDEMWTIEVSEDGANFKSFGKLSEVTSVDLAAVGLSQARFVRITDDGLASGSGVSPGAELDAVMALNSTSS